MAVEVYTTQTLLSYLERREPVNSYWLDLCFPLIEQFSTEYIELARLPHLRKLAPLVVPTSQGRPIYERAEESRLIKPAYAKPKDSVVPTRMIRRLAGARELHPGMPLTPSARMQFVRMDILETHATAIMRLWEWMAAQAIIYGQVTLESPDYPMTIVDFQRPANHSVVIPGGSYWGTTGISIIDNIETWRTRVRDAPFGGVTNRITVGSQVWAVMRKDPEIKELMKTDVRIIGETNLRTGLTMQNESRVEYVGNLSGVLDVYVYSDYYQAPDGTVVPFMDPRDIVLTGPGVQGVRCFGAIQDIDSNLQPLTLFPKEWKNEDPSGLFLMTQSAPLMAPQVPENTLHARVLA